MTFAEVLQTIFEQSETGWVYLPAERPWTLNSSSAVFESEEVPPELEDEPDAGVPEVARQAGFVQVIPVVGLQDVVTNAKAQVDCPSLQQLFDAFSFYHDQDAFMTFEDGQ